YAFAASGSATTWEWNFGDAITGSGQNTNHTYAGGGRFAVTLTGRSGSQSATATGSVDVGRPMTGSWAGAFNNRNSVLTFTGAGPTLSGSYRDQFAEGTIAGQISSGASFVCPCDVVIAITLPNTQFRFEGQRVGDQLVGAFVGNGFRTDTTLNPQ
ncbi:MAG: PKD domain-containing protein, partial [Armatimonadetes bacterium]|nr:PKD domain-containing protein [Armatimonadota bacterium]